MKSGKSTKSTKSTKSNIFGSFQLISHSIDFIALFIILVYGIGYILYYLYKQSKNIIIKEKFENTCTMNLKDIDPKAVDGYMQFDNKHIGCGPCMRSTLLMNITPCPTDENGILSTECNQNGNVVSSVGNPIKWINSVSIANINKFFCPS